MELIVSSIFRNSTGYIDRWVDQVSSLQRISGQPVTAIVAEGDSTDGTQEALNKALTHCDFNTHLQTVNHGGEDYGSYDIPQRWANIAKVCNKVLSRVREVIKPNDSFIYVESDLVWTPDDLLVLAKDLDSRAAVTPMSMHGDTGRYYDTWGARKNGQRFTAEAPFHPDLNGERFVAVDSNGSCFALRPRLVHQVQFSPTDAILGIGRDVREAGETLWLDQQISVVHP